jgi:hypothetical protein
MARRTKAAVVRAYRSKSLARRRHRLIQAKVRSTIQRLGRISKRARVGRLTISICQTPVRATAPAIFGPLVAAVRVDALDEGEQPTRPAQQIEGAVAVLNVGGMDDDVQKKAERIDEDMALAAFDFLARIKA